MLMHVVAENFTPQGLVDAGGQDAVWNKLFDRMWQEKLDGIRDRRGWVVQFVTPEPQVDLDEQHQQQVTFALQCYCWLANPRDANVGEVVFSDGIPQTAIEPDSDPPKAMLHGRKFLRTDSGWERVE